MVYDLQVYVGINVLLMADVLRSVGSNPSKADADIWIRENNGLYEYTAVYVDDLLIAA
jgi:hypothetical protein